MVQASDIRKRLEEEARERIKAGQDKGRDARYGKLDGGNVATDQKAMLAAQASDIRKRLEQEAKDRMSDGGKNKGVATLPTLATPVATRDVLAEMFDTSPRNVQNAT